MTTLKSIPISATPTWLAAVEAADCQCQCTKAVKYHDHTHAGGRCPVRQGVNGGRLHLIAGSAVLCAKCASHREKATSAEAPPAAPAKPEQMSLFDLLAEAAANA